jgi:hypothetical protein
MTKHCNTHVFVSVSYNEIAVFFSSFEYPLQMSQF